MKPVILQQSDLEHPMSPAAPLGISAGRRRAGLLAITTGVLAEAAAFGLFVLFFVVEAVLPAIDDSGRSVHSVPWVLLLGAVPGALFVLLGTLLVTRSGLLRVGLFLGSAVTAAFLGIAGLLVLYWL